MALDYSNERWVRLYTRDTATWKLIDWRARTVLLHLLRKVDRAGVLDVGDDGEIGLAAVLELPPEEIVAPGIAQLVKRGVVVNSGTAYALPAFLAAQEAPASDAQRQRDARDRRRAATLAAASQRDQASRNVTGESRSVTERHENGERVTTCHSETRVDDPIRDPDLSHRAREAGPVTDATAGSDADIPGRPDAPPPDRGQDSILALVAEAAAVLNAERARIDATAPPIDDSTAGAVTQRLMATPAADRRRKLMHAVACVVARAKATRSIEPLRWSIFGSEAAWAYVVDASVAEYARSGARPGHGARDSPGRRPQPDPPRTPVNRL